MGHSRPVFRAAGFGDKLEGAICDLGAGQRDLWSVQGERIDCLQL